MGSDLRKRVAELLKLVAVELMFVFWAEPFFWIFSDYGLEDDGMAK